MEARSLPVQRSDHAKRPRRRHAAARSRILAGALSVSTFLGLGARMAASPASTAAATATTQTPSATTSSTTSSATSSSWSATPATGVSGQSATTTSNGS
jgi:hypothetical protein